MPILAIVVAIVGFIAVWWWRAQQAKQAADTVIDMAGRAKGAISRARFKHKAGSSVLAAVDDPGIAAATLLYSLADLEGAVTPEDEARIGQLLKDVCRMPKPAREEALAFVRWAVGQVPDANEVVRRLTPLWMRTLDGGERSDLMGMALAMIEEGGGATDAQSVAVRRLSEALLPD